MSDQHGKIWWSELNTRDVDAAVSYYSDMCGWEFEKQDMATGPYWVANLDGAPVAGIMDMAQMEQMADVPPHWMTYVAVSDVDAVVKRTIAAGGAAIQPGFDVQGVGRIAIVSDPTGAVIGLMTPAPEA